MNLQREATRARDSGRPLAATPDSTSSQSPASVESQRSWPSNSSSGSSQRPVLASRGAARMTLKYSPTAVTENLHQVWESAKGEF